MTLPFTVNSATSKINQFQGCMKKGDKNSVMRPLFMYRESVIRRASFRVTPDFDWQHFEDERRIQWKAEKKHLGLVSLRPREIVYLIFLNFIICHEKLQKPSQ